MASPPIDFVQWRALVLAALKGDFRRGGRAFDVSGQAKGVMALVGTLVLLTAMGGGAAIFLALTRDLFLGTTIFMVLLAFVIASSVLIEYQSVVLSPADHRQLSFLPITSRTFFAARLTSVLVYTTAMTLAFSIGPVIVLASRADGGWAVAAVALVTAIVEAAVVVFAVIGLYMGVLALVSQARLARWLSYLQLVFSFVVYGSYMIVPRTLGRSGFDLELPRTFWALLNPASWFAGWIVWAAGERTGYTAAAAILALAATAAGVRVVSGRLTIDYADRLAGLETQIDTPGRARGLTAGRLFADGEARAVALLVRAQFRHDNRFRLTVLTIVPLTVVYLLSGVGDGGLNPFEPNDRGGQPLVYMAVVMFPPMLRAALTQSDAYRAAWIFHGTPANKGALVAALKNYVAMWFLVPYLVLLGGVYAAVVGQPLRIAVHMFILAMISHLLLTIDLLIHPDVPFSRPLGRAGRTSSTFFSIAIAVVLGVSMQYIFQAIYSTAWATLSTVIGLAALTLVTERALRLRLEGVEARAQFDL